MPKLSSNRLVLALLIILGLIFVTAFIVLAAFGSKYRSLSGIDSLEEAQSLQTDDFDIRRLKLQTNNGRTIEIFQNGTLVHSDDDGQKQAVLGYYKLEQLFGSLTEEEIQAYLNDHPPGSGSYVLTIETKSGTVYIINLDPGGDDPINELVEEIENTDQETLDPSPIPTPYPTPLPTPTPPVATPTPPGATPTPFTSPEPSGGGPTPTPSSLPAYLTAPPFDCSDYSLLRQTIISDVICNPSP